MLGLLQVGGDAQGIAIGFLLIGSLLLSNTVEQLLDRVRTRRLLGATLSPRPEAALTAPRGRPRPDVHIREHETMIRHLLTHELRAGAGRVRGRRTGVAPWNAPAGR